jgi:hypothetical protein
MRNKNYHEMFADSREREREELYIPPRQFGAVV